MTLLRPALARLIGLAFVVTSCRLASDAGVVGVLSPGAAARIEVTTTSVAGGQAMIVTERIDSAQATFEYVSCMQSVVGENCQELARHVLPLSPAHLDGLFGMVTSAPFRALRPAYERDDSINPPDYLRVVVDVTVRERTRRITWEGGAALPDVLFDFRCRVSAAGGSLALCAVMD